MGNKIVIIDRWEKRTGRERLGRGVGDSRSSTGKQRRDGQVAMTVNASLHQTGLRRRIHCLGQRRSPRINGVTFALAH